MHFNIFFLKQSHNFIRTYFLLWLGVFVVFGFGRFFCLFLLGGLFLALLLYLTVFRAYFWVCTQTGLGEPSRVPETEPISALSKAKALPTKLSCQSLVLFFNNVPHELWSKNSKLPVTVGLEIHMSQQVIKANLQTVFSLQ